jgi:amidase
VCALLPKTQFCGSPLCAFPAISLSVIANSVLKLSALDQAKLLRKREISSTELTSLYLERIERLGYLGAFASVDAKSALKSAAAADAELGKGGGGDKPFLGVPSAIKDLHMAKGAWTGFGSKAIFLPPLTDCCSAASLRAAGFVFLGKTSASEFGAIPVTEPDGQLPARNPWNIEHTPGGSSGGAGVAVAAGLLPIAHGSDGGGSVRIPASLCHLYGFKPSRWLLPNVYNKTDPVVLYTCGSLARTVHDAAAMIDAMMRSTAQKDLRITVGSLLEALEAKPKRGLRIRMVLNNSLTETLPDIEEATRKTAKLLESFGHTVEEAFYPKVNVEEFIPVWGRVVSEMPLIFPWRIQKATKWLREQRKGMTDLEIRAVERKLSELVRESLGGADLMLSPTIPIRPLPVGATKYCSGKDAFFKAAGLGVLTAPHNLAGHPAATIPAGLSKDGFPIGVQIAGAVGQDALVFQVSRQLEEAMPWAHLWSPASGLASA